MPVPHLVQVGIGVALLLAEDAIEVDGAYTAPEKMDKSSPAEAHDMQHKQRRFRSVPTLFRVCLRTESNTITQAVI